MKVHWDSVPEKAKTLDWGITNPNLVYLSTYLPTEIWRSALWVRKWLEEGAARKLFINNQKHKNKLIEAWEWMLFCRISLIRLWGTNNELISDFQYTFWLVYESNKLIYLHFDFFNFQFQVSVTLSFVPTYLQVTRSRIHTGIFWS